jgi:DNA-binding NtrC family response regulator
LAKRRGRSPTVNPAIGRTVYSDYAYPVIRINSTSHAREPASAQTRCRTNRFYRILVVDDDLGIRKSNSELLISSGYQVDAAEDGAAGWDALRVRNYDLLITDNNMPKVSGVELVKKVRSARMALPVILASGARPANEKELQLSAMLLKPFTADELLGIVKRVLRVTSMSQSRAGHCQSPKPSPCSW